MIVVPYLKEEQLVELEREAISGIDLCGNGVVIVPGDFAVFKTGEHNPFPSYAPIKNIYRRNSSMVARAFLTRPWFPSVQFIQREINQANLLVSQWEKGPMGLSTVSKALKTLEADLIIERKEGIQLLQAEKLLAKLTDSYAAPNIRNRLQLKVDTSDTTLFQILTSSAGASAPPVMATGLGSVCRYAVMQRGRMLSVYCPCIDGVLERLKATPTDRFPNLELMETDDEALYFDARFQDGFRWASPV
ncbi:MAG: hypothetical protein EOM20_21170, partial [Spartobacteria bacterium]|nr:hypothetical protein [Spartobacteria bacterium]